MEKIIFFGLVIPIMGFVLYLGASAIMKGFDAKEANRSEKKEDPDNIETSNDVTQLSNEISKLNVVIDQLTNELNNIMNNNIISIICKIKTNLLTNSK